MKRRYRQLTRKRETGQTLIIALIILGLLLILGFVFLGIIDRNITGSARLQTRSEANDLAESGIRYAQSELVSSPLGADWRGTPVTLATVVGNANATLDPDVLYLRPGTGLPYLASNPKQLDLGGPDGLGPFIRVNYDRGRALIRVRYGPSDANFFNASPTGPLRNPGVDKNYLIIESIGRMGVVNPNDPTTLATTGAVQFQNFGSSANLQAGLAAMIQFDAQYVNSRKLIALATTGIIDHARFITNIFNVSRAADIGFPTDSGATYNDADVATLGITTQLGTIGTIAAPTANPVPPGFGDFFSNAGLLIHGTTQLNLNSSFGDALRCAGAISGDLDSSLVINQSQYNSLTNSWTTNTVTLGPNQYNSRSNAYTTAGGSIIDGVAQTDANGYPRGVGIVDPPSILAVDPQTHQTRYLEMTQQSGITVNGVNSGEFGHGRGVYVDNTTDRQMALSESGRIGQGTEESLTNDWLNPNNGAANTGWRGPFYVPVGAYVQLLSDGFVIQRDATDQTWKRPDGADSEAYTLRFRFGMVNGQLYIVDGLETDVTGASGPVNFAAGQPFNGTLYFEGNVRIRGIIPTNVQLTIVSNASIYIEGSIVKGAVGNDVTQAQGIANYDSPMTQLSRSMLMMMAKDYVTVNTTQLFGTSAGQQLQEVNDQQNSTGFNAVDMSVVGNGNFSQLDFNTEFLTDPTSASNPNDPSTWQPYALHYYDALNSSVALPSKLLLTQSMANGTGAATLISMNVNFGAYGANQQISAFSFPGAQTALPYFQGLTNVASSYLYLPGSDPTYTADIQRSIQMYGLGGQPWQTYEKFESRDFNLVWPATSAYGNQTITSTDPNTDPFVTYSLYAPGSNDLLIRPASLNGVPENDYLLARAAIAPDDFRIEASIYAEEGSFFVIPGPWFNPNVNDSRDNYNADSKANGALQANQDRLETYGNSPAIPFYGEPLDVRIQVVGSISENMPPPASQQAEWDKKWAWIPMQLAALGNNIPGSHVPAGTPNTAVVVPNLIIQYDPELATDRITGFSATNNPADLIRADSYGRPLPPMPRLPVSPALTYFGENP